jgi:hypothetical protein
VNALDPALLLVIAVAFSTAGVIKGAIGMGLPTTAIAILTLSLGLREAVVLLLVPSLVANIWQIMRGGALLALLRRFWLLNAAACLGIWAGTMILFRVDPRLLSGLLGAVIMIYAALDLSSLQLKLRPKREAAWSASVGFGAGLLTGTTGSLLMPLVVYLQALGLDKDRFVQAVGLSLLIGTVAWAAALFDQDAVDGPAALLSGYALIPTLLGMMVGIWLRDRISQTLFRRIVSLFLLVIGGKLIYSGWF